MPASANPTQADHWSSMVAATAPFTFTAAVGGFCSMGLEIAAGPMLEPFGEGKDVWASIISVFILSLSVGYAFGGWMADKGRPQWGLGWVLVAAGISVATIPIYGDFMVSTLHATMPSARTGALVAALVLFLLPSVLVGMVTPMLVKLCFASQARLGTTTGVLYSVASIGNVIGTLVTNFVLVDFFGVTATMVGLGCAFSVLGLGHLWAATQGRAGR